MSTAKIRLIDKIYDELPSIACKGLCSEACGPIPMSRLEARRINAATPGAPCDFGFNENGVCDLLDATTKRCTVYAIRPLVCRLFGLVEAMRCPFGCLPERFLTEEESRAYLGRVSRIGA